MLLLYAKCCCWAGWLLRRLAGRCSSVDSSWVGLECCNDACLAGLLAAGA